MIAVARRCLGEPVDHVRLEDLTEFARVELESRDVEPWADILAALRRAGELTDEEAAWVLSLYNTYDDLNSAWAMFRRWPTIEQWSLDRDRDEAARYNCTGERRNLRGGKVLLRLDSYASLLSGGPHIGWARRALVGDDPQVDFVRLTAHLRQVWGVGRQSAFEWAEFLAKVTGLPVDCADAQLWESEGPRRSLQRLYGNPTPTRRWLDERADECRSYMADRGVAPAMVDFETLICDYNVGRDGRYYPGRHLAAIVEEIAGLPDPEDRELLRWAFDSFVPEPWRGIEPGISRELLPVYRDTGAFPTIEQAVRGRL